MSEIDDLLSRYGEAKSPEKKTRIMVVDDDPSIGRSLSKVLKEYEVVVSTSGAEALEKVSPDIFCVIMDAKMPGMDGFTTSKKIWEKYPNVPIIMHTAFHGEHKTSDVVSYHFFGYVEKGSDLENLKLQVRNACENYANKLKIEEYQRDLEKKVELRTKQLSDTLATQESLNKELAEAYQDLKSTQAELIESEKMAALGEMLLRLSHEIRNPLVSIVEGHGYLQSVLAPNLKPDNQFYEMLLRNASTKLETHGLKQLITDIEQDVQKYRELIYTAWEKGLSLEQVSRTEIPKLEMQIETAAQQMQLNLDQASIGGLARVNLNKKDLESLFTLTKKYDGGTIFCSGLTEKYSIAVQLRNSGNMSNKLIRMVSGILYTSKRPEKGEKVSIETILEQCLSDHAAEFGEIYVRKELGGVAPIFADPKMIEYITDNLVRNALDAMKRRGTLHLRTYEQDGRVYMEISDTGTGIPPEYRDKIFEPFFSTKGAGEGSGIGLAISRKAAEQHNGEITLQPPKPGYSTTFRITLPISNTSE